MKFALILASTMVVLGIGCSHGLRGRPVDERVTFESGVPMSGTPTGGCIVRAGVKDVHENRLTMFVDVLNHTNNVVNFKATEFVVKGTSVQSEALVFPVDPERTIASAAAAIEILEEKMNPSLFSVLGNVPESTVAATTSAPEGPTGEAMTDKQKLEHFRSERVRWEREAFRDGDLLEMNRARGFLIFDGKFGKGSFHLLSQNSKCPADLLFEVD